MKTLTRDAAHETVDAVAQLGALSHLAAHWEIVGYWNETAEWTADVLHEFVDECAEALQDRRASGRNPKDSDNTGLPEWPGVI